ncbi:MAG: hypothetical protein ACTSYI_04865 [Promethearchaeota archaeon]
MDVELLESVIKGDEIMSYDDLLEHLLTQKLQQIDHRKVIHQLTKFAAIRDFKEIAIELKQKEEKTISQPKIPILDLPSRTFN